MNIGRFTRNLVDSIADAGESFLNLKRLRGSTTQKLISLCDDLVSHKGVASGLALARQIVNRYQNLSNDEKLLFFLDINKRMGNDLEKIKKSAERFTAQPDEEKLKDLTKEIKSDSQKLFNRMIMAPGGTHAIVLLRADLLNFLPSHPELQPMDENLRSLLTSWFNPGFLQLRKIDWDTEASILEKIIRYEAVHDIENWNDLKKRLADDRRCFAYFHPSLEDEPLIFVEVALTKGISGSIQEIFKSQGNDVDQADTAIFYSINNCQKGLKKIPLGNFLIKIVVMHLAMELPGIKTYSTLSPVPGFTGWFKETTKNRNHEFLSEKEKELIKLTNDPGWINDEEKCNQLKKPLTKACAHYLIMAKINGKPLDPVARFHFGNGAQLYRINWMGNNSENGIKESFGLMVNYLYDLRHIEQNHEAYVRSGELAISKSVRNNLA